MFLGVQTCIEHTGVYTCDLLECIHVLMSCYPPQTFGTRQPGCWPAYTVTRVVAKVTAGTDQRDLRDQYWLLSIHCSLGGEIVLSWWEKPGLKSFVLCTQIFSFGEKAPSVIVRCRELLSGAGDPHCYLSDSSTQVYPLSGQKKMIFSLSLVISHHINRGGCSFHLSRDPYMWSSPLTAC